MTKTNKTTVFQAFKVEKFGYYEGHEPTGLAWTSEEKATIDMHNDGELCVYEIEHDARLDREGLTRVLHQLSERILMEHGNYADKPEEKKGGKYELVSYSYFAIPEKLKLRGIYEIRIREIRKYCHGRLEGTLRF